MSQKASVARGEKTIFGREGNIVFGPKHRPMALMIIFFLAIFAKSS
jgi:hypothetical protein